MARQERFRYPLRDVIPKLCEVSLIATRAALLVSLSLALAASAPAFAQTAKRQAEPARPKDPRAWMEQCVGDVLRQLAVQQVPEVQAGPTVVRYCDAPLRATLAQAIQSGEAAICTVDSCIGMARDRVIQEIGPEYRELLANPPQPKKTRRS